VINQYMLGHQIKEKLKKELDRIVGVV